MLHVYTSGVRYGVLGVTWGSRAALLLETGDRRRLRLSQAIEGLVEVIETVKRNVYPRLLASYTREYRSGKGLPFGPIRLTPQGVQKGRRSLGWGDLEAARHPRRPDRDEAEGGEEAGCDFGRRPTPCPTSKSACSLSNT